MSLRGFACSPELCKCASLSKLQIPGGVHRRPLRSGLVTGEARWVQRLKAIRNLAVAQKTGTQNGTLVSGNMDQNLHNPLLLNFEPLPYEAATQRRSTSWFSGHTLSTPDWGRNLQDDWEAYSSMVEARTPSCFVRDDSGPHLHCLEPRSDLANLTQHPIRRSHEWTWMWILPMLCMKTCGCACGCVFSFCRYLFCCGFWKHKEQPSF